MMKTRCFFFLPSTTLVPGRICAVLAAAFGVSAAFCTRLEKTGEKVGKTSCWASCFFHCWLAVPGSIISSRVSVQKWSTFPEFHDSRGGFLGGGSVVVAFQLGTFAGKNPTAWWGFQWIKEGRQQGKIEVRLASNLGWDAGGNTLSF